jgi:diaminopimelate decarboxylase
MSLAYRDGILHVESVPLEEIAARHGTPCYVYSRAVLQCRRVPPRCPGAAA